VRGSRKVLGQVKTNQKSNEITAIPELLKVLDIECCIVTIDAMGCQTKIAETIIERQADYLLAVKKNQKELYSNYITSLNPHAKSINQVVRSHWSIENNLHWQLDVSFNEDKSRKRDRNRNAAENYSVLLRMALNLIKSETSTKRSVKGKRLKAGWDNEYLLTLLDF
jgi:predicted transposase YbfD/YdcC